MQSWPPAPSPAKNIDTSFNCCTKCKSRDSFGICSSWQFKNTPYLLELIMFPIKWYKLEKISWSQTFCLKSNKFNVSNIRPSHFCMTLDLEEESYIYYSFWVLYEVYIKNFSKFHCFPPVLSSWLSSINWQILQQQPPMWPVMTGHLLVK